MNAISSMVSYYVNALRCGLLGRLLPTPPPMPDFSGIYTSDFQRIALGECLKGTYLEIYRPTKPFTADDGRVKAVVYLHGFALGPSRIYRAHIEHLARQGYYVFYPNFQTGFCHFDASLTKTVEELIEEIFGDKHLAVQYYWMQNALKSVRAGFEHENIASETAVETFLFGHSLGGLFAISWPWYVNRWPGEVAREATSPRYLLPQQIVAADPIPSSMMIPGRIGKLIAKLVPQVDVRKTGADVTMPLAILHGRDDWVVPPSTWEAYFPAIASPAKSMFVSSTDARGCGALYANHEQCTVDTSFFPTLLALLILDGVGKEDTLDWRYLWPPLDRAVRHGERVDLSQFDMGSWSDGHPVRPIEVYLSASIRSRG
jgi:pimeloyl-ACP methyl ester carboxylesterase